MVKSLIIVGIGGFIGSAGRFLISRYFQIHYSSIFPWGTFVVNIFGCFLIGIIFGISEKGDFLSPSIAGISNNGVHYPGDVIVAVGIGIFIGWVVSKLYRFVEQKLLRFV